MNILAFAAFVTPDTFAVETTSHYYQSRVVGYGDFLERNFDGTYNLTTTLAHICIISKDNNEPYCLKEIPHQPERDKFLKVMEKYVSFLFEDKIWNWPPRDK